MCKLHRSNHWYDPRHTTTTLQTTRNTKRHGYHNSIWRLYLYIQVCLMHMHRMRLATAYLARSYRIAQWIKLLTTIFSPLSSQKCAAHWSICCCLQTLHLAEWGQMTFHIPQTPLTCCHVPPLHTQPSSWDHHYSYWLRDTSMSMSWYPADGENSDGVTHPIHQMHRDSGQQMHRHHCKDQWVGPH